ncbi:sel1 repeat family protein [Pseudomonas sp. DP-17]|uniref:tetratricopeptide repeat protein n=1 Tax=Pseudomonas sp. DP-17 TaxID=1580486 RepID=UPI001EFC2481|nr:sel1 repeat family protein [Pseudomonas sp. DP-17]MCG8906950.1 sel1 repeat family protein [Pseudomonas sp. DP-17]
MNIPKFVIACAVTLLSIPVLANQLTAEQESAKTRGLTLFNQHKAISAEPFLTIAAKAGDREAQFYLGKAIQFNKHYMTAEAQKWYTAAAEQGDMYSMYQLAYNGNDLCHAMGNCPQGTRTAREWKELLINTATPLTEQGDGEAMYMMYLVTGDLDWLRKPANPGFPFKPYWLAVRYRNNEGFIFPPWERSGRIFELYKEAAEGGYPPAMYRYAVLLRSKGDMSEAREWLKKGAEYGYTSVFVEYAGSLSTPDNSWGLPTDYVKSYGLLSLALELDGGGTSREFAQGELPRIAEHLTPEQIEEAKKIGAEWKATHPPLSFFPQKLGF